MYLPIPLADGSTDSDVPDTSLLSAHEKEAIDLVLSLDRPSREGERMRSVLGGLAQGFDSMRRMGTIGEDEEEEEVAASSNANGSETKDIIDGASARVSELLLTLRDVIDSRVDYARAFVALGGLSLLLGGAAERSGQVPRAVRSTCLRVLADLVRLNRSVQYSLLDNEGIRALAAMYFNEVRNAAATTTTISICRHEADGGKIRGRIVQTMEAAICGHAGAERMFCESADARRVLESGIGMHNAADDSMPPPAALRRQSLKFLCELLGPVGQRCRQSYPQRIAVFAPALTYMAENMLDDATEPDWECRELSITILRHVVRSCAEGREVVSEMKEVIVTTGLRRMEEMRSLHRQNSNASETERADEELYLWKQLIDELDKVVYSKNIYGI